ncbi:lytic polysaccharide monooxygenase auxiliary activity family 9 protein [Nocardiopsis ansamitocini]|uniref:Chitin-binding protein n=1 Tax=Nocardiopsis ansamitocini TaxID=1670832 RepID=A0A9W6P4B4_9ACTN|nr:lytic polysaccharide monooxygenase [Nocardiopsis ansamitocini]GLU46836.1 chitin-binding protein [Nocardiopsis ansamitocini]
MNPRRATRALAVLATAPLAVIGLGTGVAHAHGTMGSPASRIAACHAEGPENPQSQACKDLVAANGSQALYDWNGVRDGEADSNHRQNIPDGQLCSGGDPAFSGLDKPGNWAATNLATSGDFAWEYTVTAPHKGYIELYVTKDGYDPDQALKWSDLEEEPFHRVDDPQPVAGTYDLTGPLPQGKSGRHVIYVIWQRTDSPEAFYSCSDVDFGGTGQGLPTITPVGGMDPGDEHAEHGGQAGEGTGGTTPEPVGPPAEEKETNDGSGTTDGGQASPESSASPEAPAGDSQPPPVDSQGTHDGHNAAHNGEQLPVTGSTITGLFLSALVAMLGGAGLAWYARRRRAAGAHRAA